MATIQHRSAFKNPAEGQQKYLDWVSELAKLNGRAPYVRTDLTTSLGKTVVWQLADNAKDLPPLVLFPGFRTTALFWDLDDGLDELKNHCTLYIVDTNGQPNASDGGTPDIKGTGYGEWAGEVLAQLGLEKAWIAGASFGGTITAKLAISHPEKVQGIFMLNPGCIQPFSMSLKNLWYNVLPILSPTQKHISQFLDKAVLHAPVHTLPPKAYAHLVAYQELALREYKDKTQKPYFMKAELGQVSVPVWLLLGECDILFPTEKSAANGRKYLPQLQEIQQFKEVGHGIETYKPAIQYVAKTIAAHRYA